MKVSKGREGRPWAWIDALLARQPFNLVAVVVANRLARVAWALLSRGETYRVAA